MATEHLHQCNYWGFYNIVTRAVIIHIIKFMLTKQEVTWAGHYRSDVSHNLLTTTPPHPCVAGGICCNQEPKQCVTY
jgi:hypothetical protein